MLVLCACSPLGSMGAVSRVSTIPAEDSVAYVVFVLVGAEVTYRYGSLCCTVGCVPVVRGVASRLKPVMADDDTTPVPDTWVRYPLMLTIW